MERRKFLGKTGAGLVAGVAAVAPAVAAAPTVKWRMTSGFPRNLDTIFGAAERLSKRVAAMTDGRFQIQVFAAGELVPGAGAALDSVVSGTVECCHTASYYSVGKNAAFGFGTVIPFGLTSRQQNAWVYEGGGQQMLDEFYAGYGVRSFLGGNTGTQMGGWFRKLVNTEADVKGLKFRIAGLGGQVWAKLGAVPQQIAGGDIYPALEKGTIDAVEWVGPYDDEKLGFYKVAKNYYYPGWWEPGAALHFFVSNKEWAKLPADFKAAFEVAAAEANVGMQAAYDDKNPKALARLLGHGVKLQRFNDALMDKFYKAAMEVYAEESAKNPAFKKIYGPYMAYGRVENAWFSLAEASMNQFLERRHT